MYFKFFISAKNKYSTYWAIRFHQNYSDLSENQKFPHLVPSSNVQVVLLGHVL